MVLFSGGVFIWFLGVVSAIYRGMGNMRFPALMMVVSAAIQVPISGVLVLGLFGLPQLGVTGAAVSAVCAGSFVSLVMLQRLGSGRNPVKLRRQACVFSAALFKDILRVALPASLSPLLTVATIVSLTAIVGRIGESALAGYGIGSRIEFLMIPLIFGLGAAMTSLVGMSVGAGKTDRAERIGWIGGAAASLLAGAGAMLWPVAATAARIIIAVGGALFLAFVLDLGLQGVYYAAGLGMVGYGLMIAGSLKLGAWRS